MTASAGQSPGILTKTCGLHFTLNGSRLPIEPGHFLKTLSLRASWASL